MKYVVLKHRNRVLLCSYLLNILVKLSLLHTLFGDSPLESSFWMSTRDNEPPHSVVLNTLAWKNPTWFPPKFNCLFKKHLLGACWIPGTVFTWWRLSSEQACPVSALMKYGIQGSFHSSGTNYILTVAKAQLCSRKGDDV